jgi:hypothetical protein
MKIELKYAGVLSTISIDVSENEFDFQATKMIKIQNYKPAGLKFSKVKAKAAGCIMPKVCSCRKETKVQN